ncbi:MAG: glutathione S-transferase family protein [Pseudomonadota bacterium]
MKLFGFPYSHNTRKVLATLHATGLACEFEIVDIVAKKSYDADYVAMNPTGLTPCLQDGDFTLWESNAILIYLCEKAGDTTLWPADSQARADVLRWLFWQNAHWNPGLDIILIERLVKRLEAGEGPDPAEERRGEDFFHKQEAAPALEGILSSRDFVTGAAPTLADFAVASHLQYKDVAAYPLDRYPNIRAWYERVSALEPWATTEPDWAALTG